MKLQRTYASICVLVLSCTALAQQQTTDTVQTVRGIQFDTSRRPTYKEQPVFCGVSVGVDLAGAIMAQFAKFGQYEAQARFNFKQRYYPVAEIGVGSCNYTNERTEQHYATHSPYFRVGVDYNFANNPVSGNRIYGGVRYGFSSFSYDLSGPALTDPVWGTTLPYDLQNLSGRQHWAEVVAGLEGRLWRFIHLGWSVRWKFRLAQQRTPHGQPYYVPGYGDNSDSSCFGGSFSLLFDISDIKNSRKHR